jgi:hypothetical protein
MGHSRRFSDLRWMSALPAASDMTADVALRREGPEAAIPANLHSRSAALIKPEWTPAATFEHLVTFGKRAHSLLPTYQEEVKIPSGPWR